MTTGNYFILKDVKLIPRHIIEDKNTVCIHYREVNFVGDIYYRVPNDVFKPVHRGYGEGENFIALIDPDDELRTYLTLLGLKVYEEVNFSTTLLNRLLATDYNTKIRYP